MYEHNTRRKCDLHVLSCNTSLFKRLVINMGIRFTTICQLQLTLQCGVTSAARHGENITCHGVTTLLIMLHALTHSTISRQHREKM